MAAEGFPMKLRMISLAFACTLGTSAFTQIAVSGPGDVDRMPGATAGEKIAACFANHSICDARGFGASTQIISSTITIPTQATLIADPRTLYQASGSNITLFQVEPDAEVNGITFDCGNAPVNPIVFANDPAANYFPNTGTLGGRLALLNVSSSSNCEHVRTGAFISLHSTNSRGIYTFDMAHIRANGLHDGLLFTADSTGGSNGYINGIHVVDFKGVQSVNCIHFAAGAGGRGAAVQIAGNTIGPYSCEASGVGRGGLKASYGVLLDGSTTNTSFGGNQFLGDIWDYANPVNLSISTAGGQLFEGNISGTILDSTRGDYTYVSAYGLQAPTVRIGSGGHFNTDGNSIYTHTRGNFYFDTANNAYVDPAGDVHAAAFLVGSTPLAGSIRAGSWTIHSSTSAPVTFSSPMPASPSACSLTPSSSAADTGVPYATSLAAKGFKVHIPSSGTLSGTYICVINNAN